MKPLKLSTRLFEELAIRGVRYSHWKSNEHLLEALAGISDLDLLIDKVSRPRFEQCLFELGFEQMLSPRIKRFDGLEDYLGFDHETGELLHLHIHYRLVLGEKRVKNHHLPVERWVLDNQTTMNGVEIPTAGTEAFLLYLRLLLKADARTALRSALKRQPHPFPSSIYRELHHLLSQAEDSEITALAQQSGLAISFDDFGNFLVRARSDRLGSWYVFRQRRKLLRQLRPYQRYSTLTCLGRKMWYRIRYSRPSQTIAPIRKKSLPGKGLVIGIVGADGSGKSTLASDLDHWLSWKLRVEHLYFGQPKRDLRLKTVRKIGYALGKLDRITGQKLRPLTRLAERSRQQQWIFIARHRFHLSRRAARARSAGHIVLAERHPMPELFEMSTPMDGPRLNGSNTRTPPNKAAGAEWALYESMPSPDRYLVLDGDLATLHSRKPDTEPVEHMDKVKAINRVAANHIRISSTAPYREMELAARRELWQVLANRRKSE
jgi:hypothetical protein